MTYKKKIKTLDTLFEKAKNLSEDPEAITHFRNDFTFFTNEIMQNEANIYISEAEKIVFSPHLIQLETTDSINLKVGGFNTAKEEYCRLIEKMRVAIEINKGNFFSVRPINTIAMTIRDILISLVSSFLGGSIISFFSGKTVLSIIISIIIFSIILFVSIKYNNSKNQILNGHS